MQKFLKISFWMLMIIASLNTTYAKIQTQQNAATTKKTSQNIEYIAETLQNLAQYEIDGSFLVGQAIDNIDNQALRDKLLEIRKEYEDNIKELSNIIHEYGRDAPAHTRDFKGFFMQGYAAMRGILSDKGVMKALLTNSKFGMKAFDNALNSDLPEEVKEKLRKIREVKQKHLDFMESQI